MAPFITRTHCPKWFQREFTANNPKYHEETVEIWRAYLTLAILSVWMATEKNSLGLVGVSLLFQQAHLMRSALVDSYICRNRSLSLSN